jgi:hypothetical protein
LILFGLNLYWARRPFIPVGEEQPVNRQIDGPGHQADGDAKRRRKQRQLTLIKILEHANTFPDGD